MVAVCILGAPYFLITLEMHGCEFTSLSRCSLGMNCRTTPAWRHVTIEACLGELQRNAALRRLIGIPSAAQVPKPWNMSRFMEVLGQPPHVDNLHAVFDVMVQRLGQVVPDLGAATAGDASALNARRPRDGRNRDQHAAEQDNQQSQIRYDVHGLPLPAGGRGAGEPPRGAHQNIGVRQGL